MHLGARMVELEDLPGVGPATMMRLRQAGYTSVEALAVASSRELVTKVDITENIAQKLVNEARRRLEIGFSNAYEVYQTRMEVGRISTGSEKLDALLGGGVETRSITEFFGEFRSGKTQLAHQLCIIVQLPREKGGLSGNALYIDTEGTFRPERLVQMLDTYGLEFKPTLENVICARAYNSDHQVLLVQEAVKLIPEKNIKLIVVDTLTSYFRSEYLGREMLAERQQKLNRHLHELLQITELHDLAAVVINQVMAKPDIFYGDATLPVGGHIVAHACTTRVYLRKAKGERRIARMIDSPWLPETEAVFTIREEGIGDRYE